MTQLKTPPLTPAAERQPSPAATSWRINAFLILAAVLLLLGLAAGGIGWRFHQQHQQALRDVQDELDRIHAEGEPITPEDMHRYHQGGPRAAEKVELWLKAIHAMPAEDDESEDEAALLAGLGSDSPGSPLAGDELSLAEKMLTNRAKPTHLAAEAARIDGDARFPIAFERGIAAETKHVAQLIRLARLCALQNRVAIAHGDAAQAIESLNLILATAEAIEFEPQTISQLLRMVILRTHFRELVLLLDNLELTDKQLADLQSRIVRIDFQKSFRRALIGERAAGYHAFHYLSEDVDQLIGEAEPGDGTLRRPADFRYYLDVMRQLLTAAESPLPEARVQAMRVDASVKELLQSESRWKKRELTVSTLLLPPGIAAFDFWANAESIRDSAVAAIAFRRYQLAHGKPPESLAALCPEFLASVPQDPFAESPAPLRLAVDDDRFAIYSVGKNLTDDRALLADPDSEDDVGIVARLSLPSRKPGPAAQPTESN